MLSVQINSRTILKNVANIKKKLRPHTKFCAVVKSDAYRLGVNKIGKILNPVVDYFAVANIKEAIELRNYGITKDILVFGVSDDIKTAIEYDLSITVDSVTTAKKLTQYQTLPKLHLAVNTGLNRYGINNIHELRYIIKTLPAAPWRGIYTHLAYESDTPKMINIALNCFQKYVTVFKNNFPHVLVHAGCSGVIDYPAAHFDMIRIGKALYGGTANTTTALTVTSQVVAIQKIRTGATVGYQGTFTATKPMLIGIISCGYVHGIDPNHSGQNYVTINNHICPIIARVGMDSCFIDVTDIPNPLGKKVIIITNRPGQTIMDFAKRSGLIVCRILTEMHV